MRRRINLFGNLLVNNCPPDGRFVLFMITRLTLLPIFLLLFINAYKYAQLYTIV